MVRRSEGRAFTGFSGGQIICTPLYDCQENWRRGRDSTVLPGAKPNPATRRPAGSGLPPWTAVTTLMDGSNPPSLLSLQIGGEGGIRRFCQEQNRTPPCGGPPGAGYR